jgi:hypothetical protein
MRARSLEDEHGSRSDEASPDDIELIEMANLSTAQTGVDGVIYISTAQGQHAPRINWYPGRPGGNAPCLSVTIEPQPRAFNHRLPKHVFDAASDSVKRWVALNHPALLEFWSDGSAWMDEEVTRFKSALKRLG